MNPIRRSSYQEHYNILLMKWVIQFTEGYQLARTLSHDYWWCLQICWIELLNCAKENYQKVKIGKTKYLHVSCEPYTDAIVTNECGSVEPAFRDG